MRRPPEVPRKIEDFPIDMRVLFALITVAVFGAVWLFDTAALIQLSVYCVSGGCGVPPVWFAIAAGALALVWFVSRWRRPAAGGTRRRPAKRTARTPRVKKAAARRQEAGKPVSGGKKKPAKPRAGTLTEV